LGSAPLAQEKNVALEYRNCFSFFFSPFFSLQQISRLSIGGSLIL